MTTPHMVADTSRFAEVAPELAMPPPTLGEGADAAYTSFVARRQPGGATLVDACVAAPIPGWVDDMRIPIEHRGMNLLVVTGQLVVVAPVSTRPEPGGALSLWLGSTRVGLARFGVGFDERPRVFTCWLVCAEKNGRTDACESIIQGAHFDQGAPAPAPGLTLRAVAWAVHHPRVAAEGAGASIVALGVLAVALRKKPRSRAEMRP